MTDRRRKMPNPAAATWTRRSFLESTLGGVAALGLAGCSDLGFEDDEPSRSRGPLIDEDGFIALNANYYETGIDTKTQLPCGALVDGTPSRETNPVAIAFRLQQLIDQGNAAVDTVETMLDTLLAAQINAPPPRNYRNLLPRLMISETASGVEPASREYSVSQNAMLSARVAMAAHAFKGTAVETKAFAFLDKQKDSYNDLLARASGFLPTLVDAGLMGVDGGRFDLLFGGYYDGVAFALSYFIGDTDHIADPQVGLDTWQAMIEVQNTFTGAHPAATTGAVTIPIPLARNGSGYQFFHGLLALPPDALSPSMADALYNVLYSYLDAALFDRLPGIYSAGSNIGGSFIEDNGLNRLSARQRFQGSQETVVNVDALAAALRLFPVDSEERETLREWIGLYTSLPDVLTLSGYFSSVDKQGQIIRAQIARQNGASILFQSTAADHLEGFLTDQSKPTLRTLLSQVTLTHQGTPITRVEASLPPPPDIGVLFT